MIKKYLILSVYFLTTSIFAQQIAESKVDDLVQKTMETFNVPGIAVGIIKDGEVVLAKGYGVADIHTNEKVNADTNFGIASNSKVFTTAALALLVDQGKIKWDDKVKNTSPNSKCTTIT